MDEPALIDSAMRLQVVKYMNVASVTVMVFDYLLILDREIRLIWRSKWGWGKAFYLLARYPAFVDVPLALYLTIPPYVPPDKCLRVYIVTWWGAVFGIGIAEAILFLRTYALYAGSRKMLIFLITLFVAIYVPVIVISELFLRSIRFGPPPLPAATACYAIAGSKIAFADFVLLMLQETIIVSLTLYRGVKTIRSMKSPLSQTLYRDGVFYFMYLFLITVGNIIVIIVGPPEFVDLLNTFQRVMHSLLSTRILLHIRDTVRHNDPNTTISDLAFVAKENKKHGMTTSQSITVHSDHQPGELDKIEDIEVVPRSTVLRSRG